MVRNVFWVLFVFLGSYVFAQSLVKVDGVIGDGEYEFKYDVDKNYVIYLSYDDSKVYVGLKGNVSGWMAVGFGSPIMNNAIMFISYLDKDSGKLVVNQFIGVGHSVKPISNEVISYFGSIDGSTRVLEFVIPRKLGNVELKGRNFYSIWAYAKNDSLRTHHSRKGNFKINFLK